MRALQGLQASQKHLPYLHSHRCLSVVGWGQNLSGQVGEGLSARHTEPCTLNHLEGEGITSVAAGKDHSAALGNGVAWSWGCGRDGKLGHGDRFDQKRPTRIESLVGQAEIKKLALGHQHTLLLDSQGVLFSCGDDSQEQHGPGSPIHMLSQPSEIERPSASTTESTSFGMQGHEVNGRQALAPSSGFQERLASFKFKMPQPFMAHRQTEVEETQRLQEQAGGTSFEMQDRAYQALNPFQYNLLPRRIYLNSPTILPDFATPSVECMAASLGCSVVALNTGEIVMLGDESDADWYSSESEEGDVISRDIHTSVQNKVRELGGIAQLQACGTFCVALTRAGKVLMWGRFPMLPGSTEGDVMRVIVLDDWPAITHIATGRSHVLLSNGHRVWAMGRSSNLVDAMLRWLSSNGHVEESGEWGSPEQVMSVNGVKSLAAGMHSSAVVDHDGQLYLWGKLLSKGDTKMLLSKHGSRQVKRGRAQWEGLGADDPTPVPGLGNVESISLGHQHAIALVH